MEFSNETVRERMTSNSTLAITDVYQQPALVDNLLVIVVSISILGLIGNLATILKIALDKKLHTPTFLAISSLAVSDFIFLSSSVAVYVYVFQTYSTPLSVFIVFINGLSITNSSFDVVFLFFLRYALIVHPMKCRQYLTNSLVISVSLALWGYSTVFLIILLISLVLMLFAYDSFQTTILILICTTLIVILPASVITILHCLKMRRLRSSTVNPAITRKMSWVISIICVLYGSVGISSILVVWKTTFGEVAGVLIVFVHSCNPYILFLFHVLLRKFC